MNNAERKAAAHRRYASASLMWCQHGYRYGEIAGHFNVSRAAAIALVSSAADCGFQFPGRIRLAEKVVGKKEAREIIETIASGSSLPLSLIISSSLRRDVVRARHRAIVEIKKKYPMASLRVVAEPFGMNHSSIVGVLARAFAEGRL